MAPEPNRDMRMWLVIPAAGSGERLGETTPKQYLPLGGETVIRHALSAFASHSLISGIVLVLALQDRWWASNDPGIGKPLILIDGGKHRCHSVLNGLNALARKMREDDWVIIHDAVRPCLCTSDVNKLISEVIEDPVGGLLAAPVIDTVKTAGDDRRVTGTVDRGTLWRAMTPQMFRFGLLREALAAAVAAGHDVTDEAQAVEMAGHRPRIVIGRADNIKLTLPEDLVLAEAILAAREDEAAAVPA